MNVKMSIQLCIFLLLLFINKVFLTVLEEEELFRENIDVHPGGDERSFLGRGVGFHLAMDIFYIRTTRPVGQLVSHCYVHLVMVKLS
jgi:hypothetical protein